MKILVLNCGSSSIKYKLFDMDRNDVIAQGGIEKIGMKGSFLKLTDKDGNKVVIEKEIPEHTVGVKFIFEILTGSQYGAQAQRVYSYYPGLKTIDVIFILLRKCICIIFFFFIRAVQLPV